jgi:hypothetical protein
MVSQKIDGKTGGPLPEDTNSTRVKHQGKREFHGVPKPALGESPEKVTVGNKEHIRGVFSVHVVLLNGANLLNEIINAVCDLLRGPKGWSQMLFIQDRVIANDLLSILAAIAPDIPRLFGVQTVLFPQCTNVLGQHAFVQTIIPLSKSTGLGDLVGIFQSLLLGFIKGKLKGLHGAPARADVHMGNVGRVNQFA